jgi:hypothetical protein
MKTYLLDTNIVIKLLKEEPDILMSMNSSSVIDYKIDNNVAMELIKGEENQFFPKMSKKYQDLLLNHMINNDCYVTSSLEKENRIIKEDKEGKLYIQTGNKISPTDYGLLIICQNNPDFILVSEDKKLIKNASRMFPQKRYIGSFADFIKVIKEI